MKNLLTVFKPKHERQQDLKNRVLKNKEAVLDIMSKNIEGARQCPFLCGAKCLGQFCELFMELKSISADGKEVKFWRCAHVETPLLLIELNQNIRRLYEKLDAFAGKDTKG
jgi:hypothetical protein